MAEAGTQTTEEKMESAHGDFCRHCGESKSLLPDQDMAEYVPNEDADPTNKDWLCGNCGRWQDSAICPTCKQLARISTLPHDAHPRVARAKRG